MHTCVLCVSVSVCMGVLTPISLTQNSLNSTRSGLRQHRLQVGVCVRVCTRSCSCVHMCDWGYWTRDEMSPTTSRAVLLWCCCCVKDKNRHLSLLLHCCYFRVTHDWYLLFHLNTHLSTNCRITRLYHSAHKINFINFNKLSVVEHQHWNGCCQDLIMH